MELPDLPKELLVGPFARSGSYARGMTSHRCVSTRSLAHAHALHGLGCGGLKHEVSGRVLCPNPFLEFST